MIVRAAISLCLQWTAWGVRFRQLADRSTEARRADRPPLLALRNLNMAGLQLSEFSKLASDDEWAYPDAGR